MKKVFNSIFAIAALMMATVSCQKEQVDPVTETKLLSFSGNVIETKAVLGEGSDASHYAVKWEEGDAFCVNYGGYYDSSNKGNSFTQVTMSDFVGKSTASWTASGVYSEASKCKDAKLRACFPLQTNSSINLTNGYFCFTIPANQTPEANRPDKSTIVMYAESASDVEDGDNVNLSFNNVVAFGCIGAITGIPAEETVSTIVISANEKIVGEKCNYYIKDNGTYVAGTSAVYTGTNSLTVNTTATSNVWFTVAPGTVTGLNVTVNTESGKVYSATSAKSITFSADKVGKIASIAVTEEVVEPSFTWDLTTDTAISQDNNSRVWDCTYATMEQQKNSSTTNVAAYNPLRLYKNHALVITPKAGYIVTKIEYADDMSTNYKKISTGEWTNATTVYNNNVVTATVTDPEKAVTVVATEQSRLAYVKVFYQELPPVDPSAPVVTPSVNAVDNISYDGVIDEFTFEVENGNVTDVTITPASNDWFEWEVSGNTITYCVDSNDTNEKRVFDMSLSVIGGNTAHVIFTQNARPKVATPVISCTNNEITITCSTVDAIISYTIDGSTPTNSHGDIYDPSNKPTITADCTVKAIAVLSGYIDSDVASKVCSYTSTGGDTSTVVIDFTDKGYTNALALDNTTYSEDFGTLVIAKGEASTAPTYYTSGTAIRFYGNKNASNGNTLTFTPASGKTITKIGFIISSISNSGFLTANVGTYTETGSSTTDYKYWIGEISDASVIFSVANTTTSNPQVRIQKIEVTYSN